MALLTDEIKNQLPEKSIIRRIDSGEGEKLVEDCKTIATAKIDKRISDKKESILKKARGE